jgi:hypothetical protein
MPRYMIVRSFDVTEPEMGPVGRRSRELTEGEFPEITWEHATRLGRHEIDSLAEIAGDVTPADFPAV